MAATKADFVKLACDSRHGCGEAAQFSRRDTQASLREALVEMNGGSTKLDIRSIRSGRANEIFSIIEEVIQTELNEYWTNSEIVNQFVDYKNAALGDELSFWIPDTSFFEVAEISEGNTGLRRQRYEGGQSVTIPTSLRGIKIYEDMVRVMAGRVDFNDMIDAAIRSLNLDTYERMMKAWSSIDKDILGGETYVPAVTGSYDDQVLLNLISHVEAENNAPAIIYGTKTALRVLTPNTNFTAPSAKEDLYNLGYFGKFYGTDCIALRQTHKLNSTDMLLDDKSVYVMAADDKPIKYVTEGEGLILQKDATANADLTYEWMYTERTGIGLVVNKKFGKYTFAN